MKEFDLAKAKAGAPVCTRAGRPARIICWDAKVTYDGEIYPIIALIEEDKYVMTYDNNGNIVAGTNRQEDLVMASVKHEGWVNICKSEYGMQGGIAQIWKSEESARNAANGDESYIATVKIEWEE